MGTVTLLRILVLSFHCLPVHSSFSFSETFFSLNLWGEMCCSCVESCQFAEQDFVLEELTILHMPLQQVFPIFLSPHHSSFFFQSFILVLLFPLFLLISPLSLPSLFLPPWALSPRSRHTGQIRVCVNVLKSAHSMRKAFTADHSLQPMSWHRCFILWVGPRLGLQMRQLG